MKKITDNRFFGVIQGLSKKNIEGILSLNNQKNYTINKVSPLRTRAMMGIGGSAGVEEGSNESKPREWVDDFSNVIEAFAVPLEMLEEIGLAIVIGLLLLLGFLFLWVYIVNGAKLDKKSSFVHVTMFAESGPVGFRRKSKAQQCPKGVA